MYYLIYSLYQKVFIMLTLETFFLGSTLTADKPWA